MTLWFAERKLMENVGVLKIVVLNTFVICWKKVNKKCWCCEKKIIENVGALKKKKMMYLILLWFAERKLIEKVGVLNFFVLNDFLICWKKTDTKSWSCKDCWI